MTPLASHLKKASYVALAGLGILLIAAVVCYKERVFFADAAYILFAIINYKTWAIQYSRYGSFISQIIPYVGVKLHWPLKAIAVGYSAGFNLFYLLVALVLVYLSRYALAILMALYYFLLVSSSWFWICDEVHQAVAWMFLLFGIVTYLAEKKTNFLIIVIVFSTFSFLTIFTHFVAIIPAAFLLGYFIIEKEHWHFSWQQSLSLCCIFAAIIGSKFFDAHVSSLGYDKLHLHNLTHSSLKDVIHSFGTPVVKVFLKRCLTNYWLLIMILATGIFALVKQEKKWLAVWTVASVIGYFVIMGLVYGDLDSNTLLFHVESEWACLGIVASAAFVFSFLSGLSAQRSALLLAGILLIRLLYIGAAYPDFRTRITLNEGILAQMRKQGITKLCIPGDHFLPPSNRLTWGIPYESLIMSKINGDTPPITFFTVNPDDHATIEQAGKSNGYFTTYGPMPANSLNQDYFIFDSTHPYQVRAYTELMK